MDIHPDSDDVQKWGAHLNLETQIDGRPVPKGHPLSDPHIPIDVADRRHHDSGVRAMRVATFQDEISVTLTTTELSVLAKAIGSLAETGAEHSRAENGLAYLIEVRLSDAEPRLVFEFIEATKTLRFSGSIELLKDLVERLEDIASWVVEYGDHYHFEPEVNDELIAPTSRSLVISLC